MTRRRTPQLDAVYDAVAAERDHPTADMVHVRVRQVMPSVSLGTVYRNLQKLAAERRVRVLHLGNRVTRYDATLSDHDHFCCEGCGAVYDLEAAPRRRRPAAPAIGAGFAVRTEVVTFYGLCPPCAPAASPVPSACAG